MAELSFRLIIQTSDATGKLQSVKQEAEAVQNAVEKPSTFKVDAEKSLATVRDLSIALQGVLQVITSAAQAMKGFLDEDLKARQAMTLAKLAFGEGAAEMAKFAAEMQKITNFEDETLLISMSKMAQTFHLNSTEVAQLTPYLLDFTEGFKSSGMTVDTAFDLMGRALNGHTEMLGRYGIELDDTRLKTEGVGYLVEKLSKDYGGNAIALADLRLQNANAWGDIKENIGGMLNEILTPLMKGLQSLMAWYQSLSPVMKGFVTGLALAIPIVITVTTTITALTVAIHAMKTAINPVAGAIGIVVSVLATLGFAMASASVAAKEMADSHKSFEDEIKGMDTTVSEEVEKFNILSSRLLTLKGKTDQTAESQQEMTNIIKELNTNYSEYLGNINLETSGYNSLATALQHASEALVNKKIAEIYGKEYNAQISKVAELQVKFDQLLHGRDYADLNAEVAKRQANFEKLSQQYQETSLWGLKSSLDKARKDSGVAKFIDDNDLHQLWTLDQQLKDATSGLDAFAIAYRNAALRAPKLVIPPLSSGGSAESGESEADKAARELEQRKKETMDLIADLADARKTETAKIKEEYDLRLADIMEFTEKDSAAQKTAIDDLNTWKAAKEQELADDEKQKIKDTFTAQIDYYSNLESLGVSSYDALKKQMEDYYAWAKVNLTKEEADLILAQLQETNLRWGEHDQEMVDKERAHMQELQDIRGEYAGIALSDEENSLNKQLTALERYFENTKAKMIEAGLTEVQIAEMFAKMKAGYIEEYNEKIIESNNQTTLSAAGGVSGMLGNIMGVVGKESKKSFETWKKLAIAQGFVNTFSASLSAFTSMIKFGPILAFAAAAAAMAFGLKNIADISAMEFEPPQAARGGYLNGPAHSQGGVIIEAEGDEYITAKDRVRALGRGLYDFLNFAPIAQVKMALSGLSVPYVPMPAMAGGAYGVGGSVGGNGVLDRLFDIMSDLKDEIKELKKAAASKPNFIINVDPLSNNPVKVSEINDKGKLIRSGF